jgi:hypothetical protein
MTTIVDLGGNTIITENIRVGATAPGQAGTDISGAELTFLDGAAATNAGTNKAMITGTSGAVTVAGVATFNANPTFGAGNTLNLDSATASLTSNAVTVTKYAVQVTSEALTTAAGAAQAFVITLTGVAATDLAFVQAAGGTNTREHYVYKAICTTNTITVTVNNIGPTDAINGTLIFNLWVLKA